MITKWGQQKKLNEETSENNMLTDLFGASEHILISFSLLSSTCHCRMKLVTRCSTNDVFKGNGVKHRDTVCWDVGWFALLTNTYPFSNPPGSYQWGDGKNGDQFWGGLADVDGNKSGNNTCNILKGTDGNQFPPGVQKENPQWIFNPAPCRSFSELFLIRNKFCS